MRVIFYLFAITFITSPVFSQRYLLKFDNEKSTDWLDKAEQAYVSKNYEKSIRFYGKLMDKEGEKPEILFNQLTSLVHTGDTLEIEKTFKKLFDSGWIDCNLLSKNIDFLNIQYKQVFKIWEEAVITCGQNNGNYSKKIEQPELRQQLLWLQMEDIAADVRLIHKFKYGAEEEILLDVLKVERKKIYVNNFFSLLNIIEDNGWLGIKEIGEDGAKAVWLIAQHGNHMVEQQEELLGMMKKSMDDGNFEKQHYAHLYDRVQANRNKPQRYGTLRYKDKESGEWMLYIVEDKEKLATYRDEMGLPPLKK